MCYNDLSLSHAYVFGLPLWGLAVNTFRGGLPC